MGSSVGHQMPIYSVVFCKSLSPTGIPRSESSEGLSLFIHNIGSISELGWIYLVNYFLALFDDLRAVFPRNPSPKVAGLNERLKKGALQFPFKCLVFSFHNMKITTYQIYGY